MFVLRLLISDLALARQPLSPAKAGEKKFYGHSFPGFRSLRSLHPGLNSSVCFADSLPNSSNLSLNSTEKILCPVPICVDTRTISPALTMFVDFR
jgi:hypothetical protein